ncbi:1-aminocyclopropane-1-carboxylate deaminase/D-cysteine desulfhydrase [Vibrio ziniensis]|uniref:1-aminocyclopropane-1-carboxylate deaminase/D-cysteine desulfhydrase n=1 Tax=Vibrio ziniensis TaxID=2711221 RepID=A0A6G7CH47_9VIBR|nr:1-aminocyclopropane-1-carboxylate deaminase/D-cysteine desulfhydrase [Vibrio ziniensis]QIH41393.1 1-aminocyclopropane-1-carboxylate deaminase/D-cysteine desulfhydrase [Vibrio ziniensis]
MKLADSPITEHHFNNHHFYLKRDDQLHSQFSGNKARKFMSLLEADLPQISTLIGFGSAQANSLYSLAALASIRGWKLEFYVDHIPSWLKQRPIGNYRGALELNANIIETRPSGLHPRDYIEQIRQPDETCLPVPEGGRSKMAEAGVKQLGMEILEWIRMQPKQEWCIALPSGTGTTALFLHKTLKPYGIQVITCPCVGGTEYLVEQFNELGESSHPEILQLEDKHYFGHLYREDFDIWQQLQDQTHVEFDLLYDPIMWRCLSSWFERKTLQDGSKLTENHPSLIYIHQGGLLGNESMLPRYQRHYDL